MNSVRANLLSPTGQVTAVGIAAPAYGAPVNPGDAMDALAPTPNPTSAPSRSSTDLTYHKATPLNAAIEWPGE
jgi:hypothetical protein